MARKYRFEKDYTHIVRDPKTGLVTGHVDYPEGHEGMIKEEHIEGADAAKAGAVVSEGDKQRVAENADAFKSGSDNANV